MRKYFLTAIISIAAIIASASGAKPQTTILNPDYQSNNTQGMLEILRIERGDAATTINFEVYNVPKMWFTVDSLSTIVDNNGKVYKLTGSGGIELNKRQFTSEQGIKPFTLSFEPVDKNATSISYMENSDPNSFRIMGIELYESKKAEHAIKCVLRGEVVGRPHSSRMILRKNGQDFRIGKIQYITIRNGKFEDTLNCDYEEQYELIFLDEVQQNGFRPIDFISEPGVINFTLNPMNDFQKNKVEGGKLNREFTDFQTKRQDFVKPFFNAIRAQRDSLEKNGMYYTTQVTKIREQVEALANNDPKRNELIEQYMAIPEDERYTPQAVALDKSGFDVSRRANDMALQYSRDHIDIVGYTLLVDATRRAEGDKTPYFDLFTKIYAPKYPKHPYTEQMRLMIIASAAKEGGKYPDVTAMDLQGKPVLLSSQISGKVALIHLWASWCGPCRKHGKEMIPVYEKYKDKGFVVVGIARESGDTKAMESAMKMDRYPWNNYVELNDKDSIWIKYGIGNAGGGDFLVDENGIIIGVGLTAEQVEAILAKRYK